MTRLSFQAVIATILCASWLMPIRAAVADEIVAFVPSSTNLYIAQWQEGARTKAAELGCDIKIVENNFDQAKQGSQVQLQLASGSAAAGYSIPSLGPMSSGPPAQV